MSIAGETQYQQCGPYILKITFIEVHKQLKYRITDQQKELDHR